MDVEKSTLIEGLMLTWVMLLVTGVRDLPKLKPLEIWAVLCNCRDQMFKLDLQGNSLSRAHRKHSQILLERYILYYYSIIFHIIDCTRIFTLVFGKQVMKSISVTWLQ